MHIYIYINIYTHALYSLCVYTYSLCVCIRGILYIAYCIFWICPFLFDCWLLAWKATCIAFAQRQALIQILLRVPTSLRWFQTRGQEKTSCIRQSFVEDFSIYAFVSRLWKPRRQIAPLLQLQCLASTVLGTSPTISRNIRSRTKL